MRPLLVLFLLSLLLLSFCGCSSPKPTMPPVPVRASDRVTVECIGVFEDGLAYNEKRGIYLIKDVKTGQEYIGISGVGITETARHSTGKASRADER